MRYLFCALNIFLIHGQLLSQTGPGGIENTNGSSDLILWLDANQIDDIYDTNPVNTWYDASGYGNDCSQANSSSHGNLASSSVNGFPAVEFDGNDYLEGNLGGALNAPATLIVVPYFDADQTTENDYVFSVGSQRINGRMFGVARRKATESVPPHHPNEYYCLNGDLTAPEYGPVINSAEWHIFTQYQTTSDPEHQLYFDGDGPQTNLNTTTNTLNTDGNYAIGRWSDGGATFLNGKVAEIILFKKILNTAERNIINSYLSAKYAISLTANDKYAGDDTPDFDLDVFGIGRHSSSEYHSESRSKGLRLKIGSFSDGDYVLAGHNTTTNSINTTDKNDAGGTLEARWDRQWWIDLTNGTSASTTLIFDIAEADLVGSFTGSATNYKLLYRSTNTPGDNWTLTSATPVISGNLLTFNNVDIDAIGNDGYYTIGTIDNTNSPLGVERLVLGNNGPGGIGNTSGSSDLELWLDMSEIPGNTGDFVLSVEDKSGNNNHANQSSSIPNLVSNSANGNNTIVFDGVNTHLGGTISGGLNAPATITTVTYFENTNQASNDYVISIGASTATNDHTSIGRRQNGADVNKFYAYDGTSPANTSGVHLSSSATIAGGLDGGSNKQWTVLTQTQKSGTTRLAAYIDGAGISMASDFSGDLATDGSFLLGRWTAFTTNYLDGEIAEVIVYKKELNEAELNILHAYLGAKYAITITGDLYAGDETPNFDLEVAGIGTASDATTSTTANSAGLQISQNGGFGNGDYVLLGHNTTVNTVNESDVSLSSGTMDQRLERIWYFDITDAMSDATVNISFDFSDSDLSTYPQSTASNYKIIFRSTNSGNWTVVGSATSISSDQITFNAVSMATGDGYYTVGTINAGNSPLPVNLTAFEGRLEEQLVVLDWTTLSEINNDRFVIERSTDNANFEKIGSVLGSGNSNIQKNYTFKDLTPPYGRVFYRLHQMDFDGQSETSKSIEVFVEKDHALMTYPNPSDEKVKIQLIDALLPCYIKIYDSSGSLVHQQVARSENTVHVSLNQAGLYHLVATTPQRTFQKKIFIQN